MFSADFANIDPELIAKVAIHPPTGNEFTDVIALAVVSVDLMDLMDLFRLTSYRVYMCVWGDEKKFLHIGR